MTKLDEPALGGLEGMRLGVLDSEPSDLFFVS